ncbi:MAG: hypothetical protein M1829_001098 [Trizodia sp. TS-e1964]|nr:MAG: hypothetical protein M1829_001098 [Trizodia sp. TS-e1964]
MLLHLTLLTSTLPGLALASPYLARRDKPESCQHDNLYRCLDASPSSAASFCNSVLGTSTITAQTVTPSTTVTSSFTLVRTQTLNIQATTTSTLVLTSQSTQTITSVSTSLTTATTTVTSATLAPKKARREDNRKDKNGLSCATKTSYPASRLSSACSCLYTRSSITVTPTAATKTVVSLTTASQTVTLTIVSTITVPATIITTSISTTLTTTTTASTATSTIVFSGRFSRAVGPDASMLCSYFNVYNTLPESTDPGPNNDYSPGVDACRDACAADASCAFFLFVYNPNDPSGPVGTCQLSKQFYNQAYLHCNNPSQPGYYVGYNKGF